MGARTRRGREKSLNPKATIHLWNPGTERGQLELAEDPECGNLGRGPPRTS